MTPGDLLAAYVNTGRTLAALTVPYALHLLYLLAVIEIATIGITYAMDEDSPGALFGRGMRCIFTTGFAYWWIVNCFSLATIVIGSFNQLGQAITGLPDLTPVGFVQIGTRIAEILWNAPSSAHYLPDIPLALGEIVLAVLILIVMLLIAGVVIFTLAAAWLIVGPGTILVPLMVNRFTSRIAEGYFTWLIRVGVLLLFFFVTLGTAQHFAQEWSTTLTTQCGAVGGKCSAPIPIGSLLTLLGSTVILAFICIGVPFTAAHIVGGGVNMALEHLAAARYLAGGGFRSITKAIGGLNRQISRVSQNSQNRSTLQQRLAAGAAAASSVTASRPTAPLPRTNAYGVQRTQNLASNGAKPTTQI